MFKGDALKYLSNLCWNYCEKGKLRKACSHVHMNVTRLLQTSTMEKFQGEQHNTKAHRSFRKKKSKFDYRGFEVSQDSECAPVVFGLRKVGTIAIKSRRF